ncbi:MAG: hypothetical protein LBK06_10185 [Planctomycetaceae bacterium]|nr:hypothetical protein [Planctomycetaceae bacterium]
MRLLRLCGLFNESSLYAKAVLKFAKLNTVAQQREAVNRGRSLLPYRLRYNYSRNVNDHYCIGLFRFSDQS